MCELNAPISKPKFQADLSSVTLDFSSVSLDFSISVPVPCSRFLQVLCLLHSVPKVCQLLFQPSISYPNQRSGLLYGTYFRYALAGWKRSKLGCKMAQWVKCLFKRGDLSSHLQGGKKWGAAEHNNKPSGGKGRHVMARYPELTGQPN